MSIAQAIIGKKPAAKAPALESAPELRPLTPEELIDAVAEQEFPIEEAGVQHDTTGVGSAADGGSAGSAMKTGKGVTVGSPSSGVVTKGSKKTKGQVANTPKSGTEDPVKYGKK
jgi:hypothetical protein